MLVLGMAVAAEVTDAKQQKKDKRAKKQKDKKSRILRNLRKEAPVILTSEGEIGFDEDSLAIKCLTSKTKEYKKMGALSLKQAKIFVCQTWVAEVNRADQYLIDNFQIGLLTDDDINYDDQAEQRGVGFTGWTIDEGPNAKNTVLEFVAGCNTISGEELTHAECRERYNRREIKRSKEVCRKELRNRAANKGKWWTVDQSESSIITA